jgi:hypothetical protein
MYLSAADSRPNISHKVIMEVTLMMAMLRNAVICSQFGDVDQMPNSLILKDITGIDRCGAEQPKLEYRTLFIQPQQFGDFYVNEPKFWLAAYSAVVREDLPVPKPQRRARARATPAFRCQHR